MCFFFDIKSQGYRIANHNDCYHLPLVNGLQELSVTIAVVDIRGY